MLIGIGTCAALVAHLYGYRGMIDQETRRYDPKAIGSVISKSPETREILPVDDISAILKKEASDRDIKQVGRRFSY